MNRTDEIYKLKGILTNCNRAVGRICINCKRHDKCPEYQKYLKLLEEEKIEKGEIKNE